MNDIKPENRVILYNMDNDTLQYGDKYKKYFDDLSPLINNLETYVSSCNEIDFDKSNRRLKFNDTHAINICDIFDNHQTLLSEDNNNLKIYLFYYGYWVSKIACKYFEMYFNEKIYVDKYTKNITYVHKKCTVCNEDVYENVRKINDFNDAINNRYLYSGFYKKPFVCRKCENKNIVVKQEEKNKIIFDLNSMPYKDYLETDHWKILRKRKLKQSGYKCQLCASKTDLNVHHNTYENRGCEKDEDLVVLCKACHEKFHNKIEEFKTDTKEIIYNQIKNKSKLFVINLQDNEPDEVINKFISSHVHSIIDIKTNLFNDIYTTLLIYQ